MSGNSVLYRETMNLFVGKKCTMSGNSVLCREIMNLFVGKKWTLSGNNDLFCLEIVYHSYLWAGGLAGIISGRAAWLAGRSSERRGAGRGA
jgi:hypothetical protein